MTKAKIKEPAKELSEYRVELPGGPEIRGTLAQVTQQANASGHDLTLAGGFYLSTSKGIGVYKAVKVMHLAHQKNGIITHYKAWVDNLRKLSDTDFVAALVSGPADNENVRTLVTSFADRVRKGESSTDKVAPKK